MNNQTEKLREDSFLLSYFFRMDHGLPFILSSHTNLNFLSSPSVNFYPYSLTKGEPPWSSEKHGIASCHKSKNSKTLLRWLNEEHFNHGLANLFGLHTIDYGIHYRRDEEINIGN